MIIRRDDQGICYVGFIRFLLGIASPTFSRINPSIIQYKKIKLGKKHSIFVRREKKYEK